MMKSGSATILSSAARVSGELVADEDVILAGAFEGVLRTSRSVQVATTGSVRGEIHAESVVIMGRVDGPVTAVEKIELQSGASVNGDLAAARVRIHDDVVFNGHCRITGADAARRQYLVPAFVQAYAADANPQALAGVQTAAEGLLRDFGFEPEVRTERVTAGMQTLRPIFRSRDPLPYSRLRERMRSLEEILQSVSAAEPGRERRFGVLSRRNDKDGEALQTTGADGARALLDAMAQLRNATLMLGPVIVTRLEEDRGPRLTVRAREDSMPAEAVAQGGAPDPGALLLSLQKVQTEVVQDLGASYVPRAAR
jgi:cytoskeletal protein CcmA (bactofilin family)